MKRLLLAATASLVALSGAAMADPGNGNGRGWGGGNIPPGQAKKMQKFEHDHDRDRRDGDRASDAYMDGYEDGARDTARMFRPGERLPAGYTVIRDYNAYGLPYPGDGYRYVRYDRNVYKIAQQTAAVTAIIGALASLN